MYGPTAVGKSDFAEKLAAVVPSEIINMDVGQLYAPLSIGTAKPNWQASPIPHHLFDVLDSPVNYTVTQYRDRVITLCNEIWSRGKVPILVGGSGFYLKSLFFPIAGPHTYQAYQIDNSSDLWQQLYAIDPQRASAINPSDEFRIKRALTIWASTGVKPSEFVAQYCPPSNFHLFFLTRDRQELYDRINQRVHLMMKDGFLAEVQQLMNTPWEDFLKKKKLIGYNELIDFLLGLRTDQALQDAVTLIQQRTRHYAKRQLTFWRMLSAQLNKAIENEQSKGITRPVVESLNLTLLDVDLYIKHLSKQLINAQ